MNAKSNIDNFLIDFELYGEKLAVIWKDNSYSYSYILKRIDYWRSKLEFIQSGTIIGIEGDFSPEAIAILFVLIEKNVILVPLDINHTNKNEKKYDIAELQLIIRIKSEDDIKFIKREAAPEQHDFYKLLIERNVPGLVLFTSGTSGEPKAALHDFSKLLAKFNIKRKALRTINFLLFDHWGGLNTLFHILSNGGTVVIVENRTPDYVCTLIEKYEVEILPTSPTFINSDFRPKILKYSSFCSTESPVINHPSSVNGLLAFKYPIIAESDFICNILSTTLVWYPSPPIFTQRDPLSSDFDLITPSSIKP